VVDRHIIEPVTAGEATGVAIERGTNIVPPPAPHPVPPAIRGRVLIVLGDDVSTGDMTPDGALGLALWSNIPACAEFMFRRADKEFHRRALEWEGGVIAAGHNYGQGSSREQAALSASHLGIRTIVAKSFARIHRQNLIAQGILPLVFSRDGDHDAARVGDEWRIDHVRDALAAGDEIVPCLTDSGSEMQLSIELLPRERRILLAGGMLGYLRSAVAR
jgi:aconitate hydratase